MLEVDARLDDGLVRNLDELGGAIASTKVVLRLFSQRHPLAKLWRRLACGLDIVRQALPGYSAFTYLLAPDAARDGRPESAARWKQRAFSLAPLGATWSWLTGGFRGNSR